MCRKVVVKHSIKSNLILFVKLNHTAYFATTATNITITYSIQEHVFALEYNVLFGGENIVAELLLVYHNCHMRLINAESLAWDKDYSTLGGGLF